MQEFLSYLIANYQYEFSWFSISASNAINFIILVLLTPFAATSAMYLIQKEERTKKVIAVALISLVIALIHRATTIASYNFIYSLYSDNAFSGFFGFWRLRSFGAGVISSLIFYWIVVGIFIAAINNQRLIDKEKELANARLNALMTQLRPHFLFNTLNSISSLIDIDKSAAQKMISRFGDLLRGVLEKEEKQFVTLQEEISFLENYLSIEMERFSDRLTISYQIDPRSLEDEVPTLILQPLVENAIKHGIATKAEDGKIEIASKILNGTQYPSPLLELTVTDNGAGLKAKHNYGIGLQNVTKRLSQLYGKSSEFEIENNKEEGCTAIIRLPLTKE